jgi:hypothetical protein
MRSSTMCLILAMLAPLAGCQTIEMPKAEWPWGKSKEEKERMSEYENPVRMVAIWTDTVRFTSGGHPTRGFGGRLYFYNQRGQAIPVEGQLAVFAYDDTGVEAGTAPASRPPDRRFAFTKEQFTKHFSKTDLGASYSIWIPWDPAGGEQRHITMLPVFTTNDGSVVIGQQTANILPGKTREGENVEQPQPAVTQTGVYEGQAVSFEKAEPDRPGLMKTTTISVPRNGAIQPPVKGTPAATPIQLSNMQQMLQSAPPNSAWQSQQQTQWGQPNQATTNRLPDVSPLPQAPASGSFQPQANQQQGGSATRFERPRYRALGEPISRLGRDHAPTRHSPSAQPLPLPSTPGPAPLPSIGESSSSGAQTGW